MITIRLPRALAPRDHHDRSKITGTASTNYRFGPYEFFLGPLVIRFGPLDVTLVTTRLSRRQDQRP
jgi:hypothetical protein